MTNLCDYHSGLRSEVQELMGQGFIPPLAIRSGNPLSVTFTENMAWRGQIGRDEAGNVRFMEASYGIRAASILFAIAFTNARLTTVRSLLMFMEGGADLTVDHYVSYVAQMVGTSPDAKLDIHIQGRVAIRAAIGFKCGAIWRGRRISEYYEPSYIRDAVAASHII